MYSLVTGASSGIGLQYARRLASYYKSNLVLVSNQLEELKSLSAELSAQNGIEAIYLYKDLSKPEAPQEVFDFCAEKGIEIDVLVNNAGVFFYNDFVDTAPGRINLMTDLHVRCVTNMCRLFGEAMKKRGTGYILNMSSMSAWMALPGINVYNATKAYIVNLSRSLFYELKPYGVSVIAICPGAVDTGLYGLSDYWRRVAVKIRVSITPEDLARKALKKMFKGKKQYMPGFLNHLFLPIAKHLPDWLVYFIDKKVSRFQK